MKKVGLWMYKNDGGDIIQERLKSMPVFTTDYYSIFYR